MGIKTFILILAQMPCRSFYSYDTSEQNFESDVGNFSRSNPLRQRTSSLHRPQLTKKEEKEVDDSGVTAQQNKSKPKKHSPSRDSNGTKTMF